MSRTARHQAGTCGSCREACDQSHSLNHLVNRRRSLLQRASVPIVEALERRQLLATQVAFDFGPFNADTYASSERDTGAAYATDQYGWVHGFSSDISASATDRNTAGNFQYDRRKFSFVQTQYQSGNHSWEVDLPNGTYTVRIVAGDNSNYLNHYYHFLAEGTTIVNAAPAINAKFKEGSASVTVSDGKLTVTNGTSAQNNKICLIEITPSGGSISAPTNVRVVHDPLGEITVRWDDNSDGETGYEVQYYDGSAWNTWVTMPMNSRLAKHDTNVFSVPPPDFQKFRVRAINSGGSTAWVERNLIEHDASSQEAWGNRPMVVGGAGTGFVQAEDFDIGGNNTAWKDDQTGNAGGYYRQADVDINRVLTAAGGSEVGWKVTSFSSTEWLEYTLDVEAAGEYRLEARVASNGAGGQFKVKFDGTDLTGTLSVPDTGGWQSYDLVTDVVDLPSTGTVIMRVEGHSGSNIGDFDWFRLVPLEGQADPPDLPHPGGGGSGGDGDGTFTGTIESGMRFFDGAAQHETVDLLSSGFGMPWGHVRGWTNKLGYVADIPNGNGWVIQQMPAMKQIDGNTTVAVITDSTSSGYFDLVSGSYVARHDDLRKLVHDTTNKLFILTDKRGRKWTFNDFDASHATYKKGSFQKYTDPDGNVTQVTSRASNGRITEVQRSDGSTTESFLYAYFESGDHTGYLDSITWRRQFSAQGPWQTVRTSHYAYYGSSDANGTFHDLKTATIKDASSNVIDTWYYRYYKDDADGLGYTGAIKFIVGPAGYERADSAITGGILAASDEDLADYADQYYEYDGAMRIKTHIRQGEGCSICAGGLGEFTYQYEESLHTDGRGNWRYKTTESRPDGSRRIVYANVYGQTLLSIEQPTGSASGGEWLTFYEYDSAGRLITTARPSAVSGYSEDNADLLGKSGGNYSFLRDSAGLVETRTYYSSTTATSSVAGGVIGYLDTINLKRGETGTAVPQAKSKYKLKTIGSDTISPLAESTVYRNDDGTGGITTIYDRTYYGDDTTGTSADDTLQLRSLTATMPVVTTGQNGPGGGTGDQEITVYDEYGRVIWFRDGGGYLSYTEYSNHSGGVSLFVEDVDEGTITPPDEVDDNLPSDNGLHLDHVYVLDPLGRATKYTDAAGNITFTVYKDADQEVRIYAGWDSSLFSGSGGPTAPTTVQRLDRVGGYAETLTMSAQPNVTGGEPTGTEAISSVESIARTGYNEAWQAIQQDAYFNLSGLSYSTSASLGTENTHFYRTEMRYDKLGRLNRILDPTDTITRTVYDGLGRVISTWVGTDDVPTSGFWSPSNLAGTDMLSTATYVYDGAGVGDSNLMKLTQHVNATASDDRVSLYDYDWRNRQMLVRNGVTFSGSNATPIEYLYTTYDNLNRPIMSERFHSSTGTSAWGTTNGVPNSPTSGDRTHKSATSYDEQGRVWRSETFSVNTSTGAVGSSLKTDFWYDRRGNVIKTSSPGGLVTKNTFDGAGRQKAAYFSDGGSDTGWSDADDVAGDTVVEERHNTYDDAGNLNMVTSKLRFHDASGTGALGDPSTSPKARIAYNAFYYDKANRLTASVDVGTNGGSSYTRPGSVPSRSDTVLVTSHTYDSAGNPFSTTDPRGIESRSEYDDFGRRTKLIEAYVDGTPSVADDRVTTWSYNGNGAITSMTADLPSGETDQTTTYNYGATTARGDGFNANNVLISTDYPDVGGGVENTESYKTNRAGQRTSLTDRNGSVHAYTYDLLGRLTLDDVTTLGSGVDGTVRKLETSYNDQGLPLLLTSKNSSGTVLNQIERTYNGLGQLITEKQEHDGAVDGSTLSVQYAYSEMSGGANHTRLTSMTYPDGNVLAYAYDAGLDSAISRLSEITWDGTDVETYAYLGLSMVVVRDRPEGDHTLSYQKQGAEGNGDAGDQYTGLDRFGRIVDQRWLLDGGGHADRFTYGHDRSGNRLWRKNELSSTHSELYMADGADEQAAYDKLDRLVEFQRGTLSDAVGSDGYFDTVSSASRQQVWSLDALGNWASLTNDGGSAQTRTHDVQNRISTVSGATSPVHSANGEMTTDETGQTLKYDAWGRLVEVNTDGQGAAEITYAYDALHQRIERNSNEFYYTAQWQQIEERDAQGVEAQFVWSPVYIDAMVLRDRDSDNDGVMEATDERLYVIHDANFNITALLAEDGTWQVVERYIYDPYGTRSVLDANWSADGDNTSDYGFDWGHQGGRHDLTAGLVHFRKRDLDTSLGRWTRQDPLLYIDGLNIYAYLGTSPIVSNDPSGTHKLASLTIRLPQSDPVVDAVPTSPSASQFSLMLTKSLLANITAVATVFPLCTCVGPPPPPPPPGAWVLFGRTVTFSVGTCGPLFWWLPCPNAGATCIIAVRWNAVPPGGWVAAGAADLGCL